MVLFHFLFIYVCLCMGLSTYSEKYYAVWVKNMQFNLHTSQQLMVFKIRSISDIFLLLPQEASWDEAASGRTWLKTINELNGEIKPRSEKIRLRWAGRSTARGGKRSEDQSKEQVTAELGPGRWVQEEEHSGTCHACTSVYTAPQKLHSHQPHFP